MTMKEIENMSKEIYLNEKDVPAAQKEQRYKFKAFPTPGKKFTSLKKLENRIDSFFDPEYEPKNQKDLHNERKTVLDLAYWLGYRSRHELYKAIYDKEEPAYGMVILGAVDKLNADFENRVRDIAEEESDTRTLFAFVERDDKLLAKYNPEEAKDEKAKVQISIKLAREERVKSVLADNFSKLNAKIAEAMNTADDTESFDVNYLKLTVPEPSKEEK